MITEDRYIEILTAALQRQTMTEADVQWNVKLANRQFDVLAKLRAGMHDVLIGYEVKNRSRPISVEAMDAFVTKTRDSGINKSVFVSRSGFQKGAIEVAKRHNVDLFTIELLHDELPGIDDNSAHVVVSKAGVPPFEKIEVEVVDQRRHMNVVEQIDLVYSDGGKITIPDEPTQMTYYLERSVFPRGCSLADLIDKDAGDPVPIGESLKRRVVINDRMTPPDSHFFPPGHLAFADLHIKGVEGSLLSSNARFEITSVRERVRYTDLATGLSTEVYANSLPVGPERFAAGSYYFVYGPLRYYYCEKVVHDIATIHMVESFQSGEMIQVTFTQEARYGRYYHPLDDQKILRGCGTGYEKCSSPRSAE